MATADHLGPLFRAIFPDSNIAKKNAMCRKKTTAIINETFGPYCHDYIVEHCKTHPFTVGTDGSNDTGIEKMNPVTIKLFDTKRSKTITNHFFDMCLTSGEDGAKAFAIFDAIDKCFTKDEMPWSNCVCLSVDNTNAMIGVNNSVASRFLGKNEDIFVGGCPCHLCHIAASSANDAFSKDLGIDIEDVCVNAFYWFDKSAKRKGKLHEYFAFCNQEYLAVLKHLSVHWLSLERCLNHILKKFPSLKSYFLSESWEDERFKRLQTWVGNPLLEPIMMK